MRRRREGCELLSVSVRGARDEDEERTEVETLVETLVIVVRAGRDDFGQCGEVGLRDEEIVRKPFTYKECEKEPTLTKN